MWQYTSKWYNSCLNYFEIFMAFKQFINIANGRKIQTDGPRVGDIYSTEILKSNGDKASPSFILF